LVPLDRHFQNISWNPQEPNVSEVKQILESAEGVVVNDAPEENGYPTPLEVENSDYTYVGRIRKDLFNPKGLSLWIVADNLRKGAASNAVQIIEAIEKFK